MENLKGQGKSESNIQIHPSLTYQIDHGEEGIENLRINWSEKESAKKLTPSQNFLPNEKKNQRRSYICYDEETSFQWQIELKLMNQTTTCHQRFLSKRRKQTTNT